jgi:DNA-binding HxlR family transcriptional regulator
MGVPRLSLHIVGSLSGTVNDGRIPAGGALPRSYDQLCPIARTLDIIGERWTLLMLREMFFGKRRFTELHVALPGVPSRVLSERLKTLETHGIVRREQYNRRPPRSEYVLTDKGRSLQPVVQALFLWGIDNVLTPRERALVLRHLYGDNVAADASASDLRFPEPRTVENANEQATRARS